MDDMKIIGGNIRALRKEKGMTQAQLAKALGISVATLSSYETGKTAPSMDLIFQIARHFKTSIDKLLKQPESKDTFNN